MPPPSSIPFTPPPPSPTLRPLKDMQATNLAAFSLLQMHKNHCKQCEEVEHVIDKIVGMRIQDRKVQYQVKWKDDHYTWEPFNHIKDTKALDDWEQMVSHPIRSNRNRKCDSRISCPTCHSGKITSKGGSSKIKEYNVSLGYRYRFVCKDCFSEWSENNKKQYDYLREQDYDHMAARNCQQVTIYRGTYKRQKCIN